MRNPRKKKLAKVFSVEEAAAYLRQIADALEQGHIKFAETELDIEGDVQLKSALKSRADKTTLKMKLQFAPNEDSIEAGEDTFSADAPEPSETAEPSGPPEPSEPAKQPESPKDLSYKKLKKRMAAEFKQIKTHLKNEEMPPWDLLEAFSQDCRAMITFPDRGEEYYPPFEAAARDLLEAAQEADLVRLTGVIETLDQLKNDCHDRYK